MTAPDTLILAGGPGERRIALLAGDEVLSFVIDRGDPAPGDILLGRVIAKPADGGATFIDIGTQLPGYLPRAGNWHEGQSLLVQVGAASRLDKGTVLTHRVQLNRGAVAYSRAQEPGLGIAAQLDSDFRAAATHVIAPHLQPSERVILFEKIDETQMLPEIEALRREWQELIERAQRVKAPHRLVAPSALAKLIEEQPGIKRLVVDEPSLLPEARKIFLTAELKRGAWGDSGAAEALDMALSRIVPLTGGARLIFDEGAGATIIDVDAGKMDRDLVNQVAVKEIARQLRLRNIAGQIIIDSIPGEYAGSIHNVVSQLKTHLAADPIPTDVLGATKMRMIELVRTRRLPSLSDYFLAPPEPKRSAASLALEALQAILAEAEASPHRTLALVAAPAIIHYLQSRPDLIAEAQTRLGRPLALEAQDGGSGFTITDRRS